MEARLDTLQKIEIAEGVEIDLRPAGAFVRAAAFFLDSLIKLGVLLVAMMVIGFIAGIVGVGGDEDLSGGLAMGLATLVTFGLEWIYFIFFEAKKGATPGKKAMKLKVVQLSGAPITFHQSVVRNMLRVVDLLPMFGIVGFVTMLLSKRFQRVGDLAAETVVVYSGEIDLLRRVDRLSDVGEQVRPMVNLSREEQMAILLYSERANDWTEPRREELAVHAGELVTTGNKKERVKELFNIARWLRSHH